MDYEKNETCGKRIERALAVRHMKRTDLCKLANIPKSSLSLYLSGAYEPKQDRIRTMASALNVSEAWLVGYDVPMDREPSSHANLVEITDKEKAMLDLFRRIPESQQEVLIRMVQGGLGTQELY